MHAGSRRLPGLAGEMSRTLTKEDDPGMVEVRREDQQRINKFSACNRQLQELNGEESTLKQDLQNLQDATDETPAELATEAAAGATGQSADELPQECEAGMVLEAEDEHAPFESTVGLNGEATTVSTTRSLAGVQHDALCV